MHAAVSNTERARSPKGVCQIKSMQARNFKPGLNFNLFYTKDEAFHFVPFHDFVLYISSLA